MKRTTIYLAPDLEVRLKTEMLRRGQPMAELVREAVEVYLAGGASDAPPGAGAFASGHRDTASRVDDVLGEAAFGGVPPTAARRQQPAGRRRPARRPR